MYNDNYNDLLDAIKSSALDPDSDLDVSSWTFLATKTNNPKIKQTLADMVISYGQPYDMYNFASTVEDPPMERLIDNIIISGDVKYTTKMYEISGNYTYKFDGIYVLYDGKVYTVSEFSDFTKEYEEDISDEEFSDTTFLMNEVKGSQKTYKKGSNV